MNIFDFFFCGYLGQLKYGYEYLGLSNRLVITPDTERIHLAIAHALSLRMGCILIGHNGTGKTEILKDLSKICAKYSIMRNCSRFMDVQCMHTILIGLIQCGGWGCLTKFNDMNQTVMDAISMPIYTLTMAFNMKCSTFRVILLNIHRIQLACNQYDNITLFGIHFKRALNVTQIIYFIQKQKIIKSFSFFFFLFLLLSIRLQLGANEYHLNENFGIFITLNPEIHCKQNNVEIPSILKAHFRPVACIEPNMELVCSVSLFAEGFSQAQVSLTFCSNL